MTHTKGKWEIKEWPRSGTIEIVCNDVSIADVWGLSVDAGEARANAVLIAAAPQMLEALYEIAKGEDIIRIAKQAIKKAIR